MDKLMNAGSRGVILIVVPTYNRPEMLAKLLERLDAESDERFEVTVVDDGSSPENRRQVIALSKRYQSFRFLFNQKNLGGAQTRNVGARGTSKWIWFVDDDDRPATGSLGEIADRLESNLVTERLVLLNACYVRGETQTRLIPKGGDVFATWSRYGSEVNTSCTIFRRDLFEQVNGWDPALIAGQDTDLLLRASCVAKASVLPDVFVEVIEHESERITTNPRKQMRGKLQFIRKNWRLMHWKRSLRYLFSVITFYPYVRKYIALW